MRDEVEKFLFRTVSLQIDNLLFLEASMKVKLFITGFAEIAMSITVFAQAGGGAAAAAGAANATKGPEMTSGVGKYANFDQAMAHQHGGMYFAGKVAVDGVSLPWDPIPV